MNPYRSFQVARLPEIHFGSGCLDELPAVLAGYGRRVLLVTGRQSLQATPRWSNLVAALAEAGIEWQQVTVAGEPSPELVDAAVAAHRGTRFDVVTGIGGGSVLDAAKAIAGLLLPGNSVLDHLEGVGRGLPYAGPAVPFVAVPTTAGTGSEATKNAVLSRHGPDGFKKSFRDNRLVAEVAIVDPGLLDSCPKALIAANGMDAFTQLLESYVSLRASPFTDALASSGMQAFRDGFWQAWTEGDPLAQQGYQKIAYASLCSGITLAQCGLGSVHGLASPLGAYFPIPHGVVCGTLVAAATRVNIRALRARAPDSPALRKYAEAGILLSGRMYASEGAAQDGLVDLLDDWTERLALPRLNAYGMRADDIERVVASCRGGSMQTNPLVLTDDELAGLLHARL
ncbi:MAG: iron-containing alcohol dehydrogenase [Chromatiaceae bacterium]|nr:iron-containing alcohol dehydrogenase [Chromatiaceae bacterium]MCP5422451.1 iron-containing alcohol dehydrogenase [Chromatiaceae bacterium]